MKKPDKRHRLYAGLLRLYPKPYRQRYAQEILQTTDDMLKGAPNRRAKLGVRTRLAVDLPLNAGKQQLHYVGEIMQSEMPGYIKRNALLASVMLLPFLAAVAGNSLDRLINHRDLYGSWLWHAPILRIWVVILPGLAFLFSFLTYLVFVLRSADYKKRVWLNQALNIRRSWPIILPGLMAFGILLILMFHDSTHCWVQTPTHLLTHLSQTWQCTIANRAL